MKVTKALIVAAWFFGIGITKGYTFHDPIHTVLNIGEQVISQVKQQAQHVEDLAKYTEMIQKQVQQINQFTTMINQNVEHLRRLGNPDTYINMLGLGDLLKEVDKVADGAGKTIEDFRRTADGLAALKNTGQGLYQDFSALPDKFGQRVQYEGDEFKKFGVVQEMYEDYNLQLTELNSSIGTLENEAKSTTQSINSAGSLVETEKYIAKLHAVQGTIENHLHKASLAALKVIVQGEANRNNQARQQEVARQRQGQEMMADEQRLRSFGVSVLGPAQSQ
jgi:hypothetical protein